MNKNLRLACIAALFALSSTSTLAHYVVPGYYHIPGPEHFYPVCGVQSTDNLALISPQTRNCIRYARAQSVATLYQLTFNQALSLVPY
ncbi:MAG: hypothetical protein IT497_06660 [Ottowia sp.]|nr:hypothetical protein [Ottowia sp.]